MASGALYFLECADMGRYLCCAVVLCLPLSACAPSAERLPAASVRQSRDAVTEEKLSLLDEVLATNNDSDVRPDTAFKMLAPATKAAFRAKYAALPQEKRQARATIVYILAANTSSDEDWDFLDGVVSEPPCLGVTDCSKPGSGGGASPAAAALDLPALNAVALAARILLGAGHISPDAGEEDIARLAAFSMAKPGERPATAAEISRSIGVLKAASLSRSQRVAGKASWLLHVLGS